MKELLKGVPFEQYTTDDHDIIQLGAERFRQNLELFRKLLDSGRVRFVFNATTNKYFVTEAPLEENKPE